MMTRAFVCVGCSSYLSAEVASVKERRDWESQFIQTDMDQGKLCELASVSGAMAPVPAVAVSQRFCEVRLLCMAYGAHTRCISHGCGTHTLVRLRLRCGAARRIPAQAAYYLDIKNLVNLTSKVIASQISGDPAGVRRHLLSRHAARCRCVACVPPSLPFPCAVLASARLLSRGLLPIR